MQGSFWKTVAVVGVIGVGSLAILEVQNLLDQASKEEASPDDDALAEKVAGAGEKTVDATLQQSEFERLLSGDGSSDKPKFDLEEPPSSGTESQAFYGSDPISPQPNIPPKVDTSVDVQKTSSPNPFASEGSSAVAADSNAAQKDAVQSAGFTVSDDENPFATELTSGTATTADATEKRPFRRDAGDSAENTTGDADFTLFDNTDKSDSVDRSTTSQSGDNGTETSSGSPDFRFFSAGDDKGQLTTESAPTDEAKSAQFYDGDAQQLRPTPDTTLNSGSESFEADSPDSSFDESDSTPSDSFPDAPDFEALDHRNESSTTPASGTLDLFPEEAGTAGESKPFSEDAVPTPREPLTPSLLPTDRSDRSDSRSDTFPDARSDAVEESALPFAEDITERESPAPGNSRRTNESPMLDIPGTNDDRIRTPPERNLRSDFSDEPFSDRDDRGSGTLPERGNGLTITPRTRDDQERSFDSGGRIRNDGVREFDSGRSDPRDLPASESSVPGLRRVSGVMRPNMVLQKSAPENAIVGTPLDYKIFVKNEGDATAFEVVVEDEVTAGATVDGTRPKSVIDRSTNKLIWKFDEIKPGETKEITVQVTPTGEGTLDGVATVRFKARVKATTVITAPKLRLEMKGPDEVRLGEEVAYRYIITNEGTGEARKVYVRTVLPASGGLKHPAGNDLEYEIESLKPNEQREIVLAVVAAEPGDHRAEAEVTAAGGIKDQAAWRTKIVGAQLNIVRRGPKRRFVGRAATYENIVSNETNFDALDAKIVEQIPEGMKFLGANLGGRHDEASRSVTWRINRIGSGQQETLQIKLMPMKAGSRESIVTVFENAGIQSDDHVSTTVVEDLHNVGADISQLDGPVALGENFGFTITVDNRGTADATDVELEIDVPKEIQVVGAGSRQVQARLLEGNVVKYNVVIRIPPNQSQEFELKLKGVAPVRNGAVKASVKYAQNREPLIVSESVTVFEDR